MKGTSAPWTCLAAMLWVLFFALGAAASPPDVRVKALIDAAHTDQTRDCVDIEVGSTAEVSAPYRVEIQASYGDRTQSASLIELERGTGRSIVRVLDANGRRTLVLTGEQEHAIDQWARTAITLDRATSKPKGSCLGLKGMGFASHMPSRVLEIRGGARRPLLQTASIQPIHDDLGDGLAEFTATWAVLELEGMLRTWMFGVAPLPFDSADAQAELRGLGHRTRAHGREAIVGSLLAHHLRTHGDASVVPLLRRKGYDADALRVELRTLPAAQLPRRLGPLLCSTEFDTHTLALERVGQIGADGRAPLLHATHCKLDEHASERILRVLGRLARDPAIDAAIDDAAASDRPLRVQVVARALRFAGRADQADHAFLERTAAGAGGPLRAMTDEQRLALDELTAVAGSQPALHPKLVALAADLLARIPIDEHATYSGMSQLVRVLGRFGGRDHDAKIRRVLTHDDASVVLDGIESIALYDLDAAALEARVRVRKYNAGTTTGAGYSWNVASYFSLLIRADATEGLPELRRAAKRLAVDPEASPWTLGSHAALIAYLSAGTEAIRAFAALEFIRAHGEPSVELRDYLIARFVTHGVDAAAIEAAQAEFGRRASTWR